MISKILINIIGEPRKYIWGNANSILNHIIKNNESNYIFDIVIHTSYNYEVSQKRNLNENIWLNCDNENKLREILKDCYSILSNNINIIIENIDFDIGKPYWSKNIIYFFRQFRIYNLIPNINEYDIIISCRNDIAFSQNIDLNTINNNLYSLTGSSGGYKGYGNQDYDYCFIYKKEIYKLLYKCIDYLWLYKDNKFYLRKQQCYITPIFEKREPYLEKEYYDNLGKKYAIDILDKNNNMKKSLHLCEIIINHLTNFLVENNSNFDTYTFQKFTRRLYRYYETKQCDCGKLKMLTKEKCDLCNI